MKVLHKSIVFAVALVSTSHLAYGFRGGICNFQCGGTQPDLRSMTAYPGNTYVVCCENKAHTFETCTFPISLGAQCGLVPDPSTDQLTPITQKACPIDGSVIDPDSRSLGEAISLVGIPFDLNYSSARTPGNRKDYLVHIPLTSEVPGPVRFTDLNIGFLDVSFAKKFAGLPSQSYDYTWDGKDGSGNLVLGSVAANINVSYEIDATANATGTFVDASGVTQYVDTVFISIPAPPPKSLHLNIGHWQSATLGLGGWAPSTIHFYDINAQQIYDGSGGARVAIAKSVSLNPGQGYLVSSLDGSEHYIFDSLGRHIKTLNGLTGDLVYSFQYDTQNHLTSIQDNFGNITVFNFSGGLARSIVSPYGQVTNLIYDSNGFLAQVTNPNGESHALASTSLGLLTSFTKPNGHTSTMSYDADGLLIQDLGAGGNFTSLAQAISGTSTTTTSSSALGRTTTYLTARTPQGDASSTLTDARGLVSSSVSKQIGTSSSSTPDNLLTSTTQVNDARLGAQVPFVAANSLSIKNTGFVSSSNSTQNVVLNDISDIYSIQSLQTNTQLQSDPSRNYVSTYTGANRTIASITPLGKTSYVTMNGKSQVASFQPPGITATTFVYDTRGRLSEVHQGRRVSMLTYDSNSNVASETDPVGRVTSYTYDGAGRVTTQTNPDGRTIAFAYDASGNVTSVTPPGRSAHTFTTNLFDLVASYVPPFLGGSAGKMTTTYAYNLDKQITQIKRPDGKTISFNYDPATGVLTSIRARVNH
jgi:YD repeat-containing protein